MLANAKPHNVIVKPSVYAMNCGNCGGLDFRPMVKPDMATGQAIVARLECARCAKPFQLDDKSGLLGSGHFKINGE